MKSNTTQKSYLVPEEFADKTLSAFLKAKIPEASWSQVKKWVSAGDITVGKNRIRDEAYRLRTGQEITFCPESGQRQSARASQPLSHREPASAKIVYLDSDVVVVDKPQGMTTIRHPIEWQEYGEKAKFLPKTLAQILPKLVQQELSRRGQKAETRALKAVHRIDKETSGLLVFARTSKAASQLGQQFKDHTVKRTYQAIVVGSVKPGVIESKLSRDRGDGFRGSREDEGKVAITHITQSRQSGNYSWVECVLMTGRTHQIRIHLAELGHPICGEKVYIKQFKKRPLEDPSGLKRLALHAATLGFLHPTTGKLTEFSSPFPGELKRFLEKQSPS